MKKIEILTALFCLTLLSTEAQKTGSPLKAGSRQDSLTYLKNLRRSIDVDNSPRFADLLPVSEETLQLSAALWGDQHAEFARDLRIYGVLLWRTGAFEKADSVYRICKDIAGRTYGKQTLFYANLIGNYGCLRQSVGDYPDAEQMLTESMDLFKSIGYKDSADYTVVIGNLGLVCIYTAQYERALELFKEQRANQGNLYGRESLIYALATNNLGGLYLLLAQFEPAETLLLEAKSIYEKNGRTKGANYGMCINNLGLTHYQTGRLETAAGYLEQGRAIREKALGIDHPDYLGSLTNLALINEEMGRFSVAERYYLEAKNGYERAFGADAPELGTLLGNLAGFYNKVGRFEESSKTFLESMAICAKTMGADHPVYADQLQNYGNTLQKLHRLEEAKTMYQQAISIYKKAKGEDNIEFQAVLQNLANVYLEQNSLALAEQLQQRSLDICHTIFDSSTIELAQGLQQFGKIRFLQKRFQEAENYYIQASEMYKSLLGGDNYQFAEGLENIALCRAALGMYPSALQNLRSAGVIYRQFLQTNTEFMPEQESRALLAEFDTNRDDSFSTLYDAPSDIVDTAFLRFLYDNTLYYKGFLLQSATARRKAILSSPDTLVQQRYLNWLALLRQLSVQYSLPIAERSGVDSLQNAASICEKDLLSNMKNFRAAHQLILWHEVLQILKPGEAAVEFVHYRYSADSILYAALVLRPGDAQPQFVSLFEANTLAPLLHGASGGSNFLKINALYGGNNAIGKQQSLYGLIWKPLEGLLKGVRTVYCSPSGLLHRINLAAIAKPDGQAFNSQCQVVVLGSTRQLVVQNNQPNTNAPDAYLAGGIRYDADSTSIAFASRGNRSRSIELPEALPFQPDSLSVTRGGVLDYLPATAAEVRDIGQMLTVAGVASKIDTGFMATEEAFRQLGTGSPSPHIIHLATHGYFFPDPETANGKKMTSQGGEAIFKMSVHPMIRSGLIMAGAKEAWLTGNHPEGLEDGILTAYEISQMDLSGTQLVVLSACETGLGDIVGNEGVFGLQRAFKIAGVKYLIMSLWKVNDQSTREFMRAFYQHWLQEKQSIPDAFRTAQHEMQTKHPSPYDWAGFVLIE